ncbi:cytochrome c oxidase assembly protein CtaG [Kaistia sp. 32K]|uniref:cytochrome c oxidase assembly protein n=1 Tax=Kaistia sp. 32K TaxID=2795690 RepID=UPI001915C3CA|nr:cytochrome c oxidase assembly protein [Kaistia sp. 32K]BCP52572.1 cytochrome c oxidase assembly protein CtaG [Kaistia sp. 32K]
MSEQPNGKNHGLIAAACGVFVVAMVGAAFASVPLYSMFCQVTGFGGTPLRAEQAPTKSLDRTVTVRFDGNVANGIGWAFRPEQRQIKVKLGEVQEVKFIAENRTDRVSTGTAAFNVTPDLTGQYFNKIACFCFTSQTLKPGEKVEMPVTFFIDPAMDANAQARFIDTITLSYTFFPSSDEPAAPVAAVKTQESGKSL